MRTELSAGELFPEVLAKRCDEPLMLRSVFYPLGFAVEILTNDSAVLQAASAAWSHLQPRRMTATLQIKIAVHGTSSTPTPPAPQPWMQGALLGLVADEDNHAFLNLALGTTFARVSRAAVSNALYFRYHFLESLALVLISSMYAPALHAACVSRYGRGLLLCGRSGAGKSTLSYACARAGFTYTSDDSSYLILDSLGGPAARIAGDSRKFRFRPETRELFPELRQRELTPRLEGKPSIVVPASDLSGLITADETAIHDILLLKRAPIATATLVPIATTEALATLEESLYPVGEIRTQHIAAVRRLSSLNAFEFHYSGLDDAVRILDQHCRVGTPRPGNLLSFQQLDTLLREEP